MEEGEARGGRERREGGLKVEGEGRKGGSWRRVVGEEGRVRVYSLWAHTIPDPKKSL